MRVTYLKLENVAGLMVGSNIDTLEIDFNKCQNNIISIQGQNGKGKSVLLSSIHPFSYVTSLDERSTLNYIIVGKNGYKEIHYQNGDDYYVIKHYYKANKDTHSVKSYFSKNGEELNENGNVRSFLSLVEFHLGITEEMMRLLRLGSNVNSFISLAPARRKEYIGRLIEEIDLYLKLYKGISDEIRTTKALVSANATNLYNCHITDLVLEEGRLNALLKDIKQYEKERDQIVGQISKTESMMRDNNIDELRRKNQDAQSSMRELESLERSIQSQHLKDVSIEQLIAKRSDTVNERVDVQAKINSYRMSIDHALKDIERIDVSIKRITSNNDITSLQRNLSMTRIAIGNTSKVVVNMVPPRVTSSELEHLMNRLYGFNQIGTMIYTLGNRPLNIFLKLKEEKKSVDAFLKQQQKKIQSSINRDDIATLLNQMFGEDEVITPACTEEFSVCPYYRFADTITQIRDRLEEETIDGETLRYIQVISNNIDAILNELDHLVHMKIPDALKDPFNEQHILERLKNRIPLFDTSGISEYLSLVREREIFIAHIEELRRYEEQMTLYRQSGVESQLEQTEELRKRIDFYRNNINVLESEIAGIVAKINMLDEQISLVSRYKDALKYKKIFESTIESTSKLLGPLESAEKELQEARWRLRQITDKIDSLRSEYRELDNKINTYKQLLKEDAKLKKTMNELSIIQESASTRRGIPVIYMKRYLGRIQYLSNRLLDLIYDGDLQLSEFNITQDVFEVPYTKNGTTIPDVKYASQSEISLVTMALSFALMNKATGAYNVLLLDEIDGGLDDDNRAAFLKMLRAQMITLQCEQVFIVSHNMSQMINIPMDCIRLDNTGFKSKLQNVIYEREAA